MKDNSESGQRSATSRTRYTELKQMLEERRREIQAEVQGKMRDVRAEGTWGGKLNEVLDAVESSEADIQEDIEFALIQMKSETLNKINDALARLEQGDYGNCFECGEEIAEKRLRALPFAVRCKDCEEAREIAEQRERQLAAAARHVVAVPRHVTTRRPTIRGSAGGGARALPPPARLPLAISAGMQSEEVAMSDQLENLKTEDVSIGDRPLSIPSELPILPLRDTVLFPNSFMPLAVARESSVRLIDEAIAQRQADRASSRSATRRSKSRRRTTCTRSAPPRHIHKMFKLPDGSLRLIVQGLARLQLDEVVVDAARTCARASARPPKTPTTPTGSRSTRCRATSRPTSSRSSRCRRCCPTICRRSP